VTTVPFGIQSYRRADPPEVRLVNCYAEQVPLVMQTPTITIQAGARYWFTMNVGCRCRAWRDHVGDALRQYRRNRVVTPSLHPNLVALVHGLQIACLVTGRGPYVG